MKPEIETTIRTIAQSDGIPEKRIDAGIAAMKMGMEQAEPEETFYNLAEIGKAVRKHPTWLHKLEIQRHCGERLAGRFMYKISRVIDYLKSVECQARIMELHEERKRREMAKARAS